MTRTSVLSSRAAAPAAANAPTTAPRRAAFHERAVLRIFSGMTRGRLRLELPGGESREFGAAEGAVEPLPAGLESRAVIRVHRAEFFRKCVLSGDIGFGESYLDGDWETPDLAAVIAWFILNLDQTPTLSGSASRRARAWVLNLTRFANRVGHLLRPNTRATAQRNIREHYDLSNEFFALFLDRSMMYSCARWSRPDETLEQAQVAKNEALCEALRLQATDHVLEIGSGWGGWAIHAARTRGCRVTSLTISRQQLEGARARIAEAGLAGRVEVRLCDYRDVTGTFDKVVSIEMMEALGHRYLPDFCAVVDRVLKERGLAAFQFITCPDSRYDEFRRGVDFIQKHIFPGSLLLSRARVDALMARAGGFVLHELHDRGHDYVRTLRAWNTTFQGRLDEVRALGFDERFVRRWTYYLRYCEAAFAMRNISVVQALYTRPNNLAL